MNDNKKEKIELIDNPNLDRVYANYVSVTTSLNECYLTFCHIDPLNVSPPNIKAKIVAKVMIPNSLVMETLDVINTNYKTTMKNIEDVKTKK
jgi:hypothetical protein